MQYFASAAVAALAVVLGSQAPVALAARATDTQGMAGHVYWVADYGECSSRCGPGEQPVVSKKCMESGDNVAMFQRSEVAEGRCAGLPEPEPKPCEGFSGCEWRVGAPPEDKCGFADAECWSKQSGSQVDMRYCSDKKSGLLKEGEWQGRNTVVLEGCAALGDKLPQDICIVTVNYDKGGKLKVIGGTTVHEKEPPALFGACGGADLVVFATQELINNFADYFAKFVEDGKKVPGYVAAHQCGSQISPAVVLFVKAEKRRFLSPAGEQCTSMFDDDGSSGNKKGSEIGVIQSVLGPIALASTHAFRGDVIVPQRAAHVEVVAQKIMESGAKIIAWGGDLNSRTRGLAGNAALQAAGTTHPADGSTVVDQQANLRDKYDPRKAFEILAATEDILGREGETVDDVLRAASGGEIVQAPGLRRLCPTYYKKSGPGSVKGASVKVGMIKVPKFYGKKEKSWEPSVACQAADGQEVEYYRAELAGAKYEGEGSKAPSWADRIMVHKSAECADLKKIVAPEDHDALVTKCTIKRP